MNILILHEKHDDRYINIPAEKFGLVVIAVIKERVTAGYWYDDLSDSAGKRDARMKRDLAKALEGDIAAAESFFKARSSAEYEGWELITPEELI